MKFRIAIDMATEASNSWWSLFKKSWGWRRFGWKKYSKMGLLVLLSILIVPLFTLVGNWLRLVESTANGAEETPEVKYNIDVTKEGFYGFFVLISAWLLAVVIGIILLIPIMVLVGFESILVDLISRPLGLFTTFWVMGPVASVYATERSFTKAYSIPVSERLLFKSDHIIGSVLYIPFALGTALAWVGFALLSFLILPLLIGLGVVVCSYGSYFGFAYHRYTSA